MQETKKGKFVDALTKLEKFQKHFKMTILAWVAQFQKFLIASCIPRDDWFYTTSIYLEINVAQHWDILA